MVLPPRSGALPEVILSIPHSLNGIGQAAQITRIASLRRGLERPG
jgi:hypothetical protein